MAISSSLDLSSHPPTVWWYALLSLICTIKLHFFFLLWRLIVHICSIRWKEFRNINKEPWDLVFLNYSLFELPNWISCDETSRVLRVKVLSNSQISSNIQAYLWRLAPISGFNVFLVFTLLCFFRKWMFFLFWFLLLVGLSNVGSLF